MSLPVPPEEIHIDRYIAAPPARVFAAWLDPQLADQWMGPTGFTTQTQHMDARPGGEWRYIMRHATHGEFTNRIRYVRIEAPTLLEYHHDSGAEGDPGHHVHVYFEAEGEGTRIRMQSRFPSAEVCRKLVEQWDAAERGRETLGRLAAIVEAG